MRKVVWNLRSSDDRAFDRQSKGPGLETQRSLSVPFIKETFFLLSVHDQEFRYQS